MNWWGLFVQEKSEVEIVPLIAKVYKAKNIFVQRLGVKIRIYMKPRNGIFEMVVLVGYARSLFRNENILDVPFFYF